MSEPTRVCLLGAAGDTSNLGVDALLESALVGLRRQFPESEITVFDNGLGQRAGRCETPDGVIEYERLGIRLSRRVQRPESMLNMALATRLPLLPNLGVRRLRAADVVLDVSGGDSFSDIYGPVRFRAMTRQKSIVLDIGTPLVLLPQTYGPFALERNRATAANIVRRSTLAWARDAASFERLRELADGSEPGERFRLSVDLAFGLPSRRPVALQSDVAHWIDSGAQIFGVNISGLLANDSGSAQEFGLADDYATVMTEMLERLLDTTSAKVMLVPHVRSDLWVVESDIAACRRIGEQLAAVHPDRVAVLEGVDRAQEVKWVIGQCSAFCGTRMHSVIAALSSSVPAIALAYSLKTAGVLESCGQGERVVDLRDQPSATVCESAVALWEQRDEVREQLAAAMPGVREASSRPFADIAAMIQSRRAGVRL